MKTDNMKMDVVDFAWQVIDMQRQINALEHELTRLMEIEKDYHALMDSSLNHSRAMMGNVLKLCLTPGVVEACRAAAKTDSWSNK